MDTVSLQATARAEKTKPRQLRQKSIVPCVVYGFEVKDLQVQCNEKELHKAFAKAGESTIVELDVDGKKVPVLFKEVQFDAITDREIHVDFYAVNMKKEIETEVPVEMVGESPAIKELGGVLVVVHKSVTVRCLPADLPHNLTIDISGLAAFHSSVHVSDIKLPKGVKVMDTPESVVATIQEPRKEEVVVVATPTAEAVPGAEGAVPGAEGVAPAAGAPGAAPADAKKEEKKK